MYVSRAVEGIRENPDPGQPISLVLRMDEDADLEAIREAITDLGGTVDRTLEFDDLLVTTTEEHVDDVCSIAGLSAVETDAAIDQTAGDAGEDLGI